METPFAEIKHDLDADPYGTVMSGIRLLLRAGMNRAGDMSEREYDNLKLVEETVLALDNTPPA